MKKHINNIIIICIINDYSSICSSGSSKIAVVDIQKVVAASSQVKALKASQDAKNKELTAFIKNAQADVNKQTDAKKKKSLAESYEKQLKQKRES